MPGTRPSWLLLAGLGALIGLACVVILFARWADPNQGACPEAGHVEPPLEIHFTPGLEEHQSWLDFAAPQGQAPRVRYFLCADERVVEVGLRGSIEERYRINLQTRWVDWHWLRGDLATFEDPARWRLVYSLCEPTADESLSCT